MFSLLWVLYPSPPHVFESSDLMKAIRLYQRSRPVIADRNTNTWWVLESKGESVCQQRLCLFVRLCNPGAKRICLSYNTPGDVPLWITGHKAAFRIACQVD